LPEPVQAQDRLFQPTKGDYGDFTGQPMWLLAARCAAFNDNWREYLAVLDQGPNVARPDQEEGVRREFEPRRAQLTEFAILRLQRDRPGQNAAGIFEAQVTREREAHRAANRNYEDTRAYRHLCINYLSSIEWVLIRMKRGWADQPGLG